MEILRSSIVYVVDNDEAVRDSTRALLESRGIEARTYASAQDFLLASPSRRNACMLLDLHMPGMSGLELLEMLRVLGRELPVVAITGRGDFLLMRHAVRAGAAVLLEKPVSAEMLLDALVRALSRAEFPPLRKST